MNISEINETNINGIDHIRTHIRLKDGNYVTNYFYDITEARKTFKYIFSTTNNENTYLFIKTGDNSFTNRHDISDINFFISMKPTTNKSGYLPEMGN